MWPLEQLAEIISQKEAEDDGGDDDEFCSLPSLPSNSKIDFSDSPSLSLKKKSGVCVSVAAADYT